MPHSIDERQYHIEAVFDDDDAISRLGERAQCSHQHCSAVFVEIGEGFIQNDDLLPHCKRRSRDEALFLPARKSAALPAFIKFQKVAYNIYLLLYLVGREREVFAAEGDLVLDHFLYDLLVGVLQDDAHLSADVAELFALDVLARDLDFSRKFAVIDVGDDAADNIHERTFPFARVPGKERYFTRYLRVIGVFEDLCVSVVGKTHLS